MATTLLDTSAVHLLQHLGHPPGLLPVLPITIPSSIIIEHILPFLDRETYDNCVIVNREVFETSKEISTPPWPQKCFTLQSGVSCVTFAKSSMAVACGHEDGIVSIYKNNGRKHDLNGHKAEVLTIAFSSSENLLVSGSADCTIQVWQMKNFIPKGKSVILKHEHQHPVHSLSFFHGTNILASGGHELSIRLWDLSTYQCVGDIIHPEKVESLSTSPDGQLLASATWDGTVRLWEMENGLSVRRYLELGKGLPLTKVQFSPDGLYLFGLRGFRLRRWSMIDGRLSFLSGNRVHRVYSVDVSPDSETVAYGDDDGTIRISKLADALSRACFKDTFFGHNRQCQMAFAPDGKTLASGSADGTFRLWNV